MKKITVLAALALVFSLNSNAATIERSDAGDLTINVFANIIESFRVTIENNDIVLAGVAPVADGLLDLNGGLAGFDGLKSVTSGTTCRDDNDAPPVYADARTSCSVTAVGGSASLSKLVFMVDMGVKVELSGPGDIDLLASFGGTSGDEEFANETITFVTAAGLSSDGMVDQDTDTLRFYGEAPLSGGPSYDETIIVSVTKN